MLDTSIDSNASKSTNIGDSNPILTSKNIKSTRKRSHDVRVITFNVLSDNFVSNEYYPKVENRYINFRTRVEKVKRLLMSWMKVNFIICLQEISKQWYNEIANLFSHNMYEFKAITYFKDKLGLGIAFPINHYELLIRDDFIVGTYVSEIYNNICANNGTYIHNHISKCESEKYNDTNLNISNNDSDNDHTEFYSDHTYTNMDNETNILVCDETYDNVYNEMKESADMKTPILSLILRCKNRGNYVNKNIVVSTYHMPCRYMKKYFLATNIHSIKNRLQYLKNLSLHRYPNDSTSVILTGDFNINPKCSEYKLLTGETYTDEEIKSKTSDRGESLDFYIKLSDLYRLGGYELTSGIKTRSVYKSFCGSEPKYTNVSLKKDFTFIECIDYILIDDSIDIRSCTVGLTVDDPENTPYPNGLCPSDHLPLSASLFIN